MEETTRKLMEQAQKTKDVIWIFRELSASEAAEPVKDGKEEPSKWKFPEPHKGQWEKHAGYNPARIMKRQTIDQDRKKAYVIITTSAIIDASDELANFVAHKKSRGFNVKVITEKDFGGGVSDTAADNIRRWLQKHYLTENIQYVLLVGDPHPETGEIPMKMIWTHSGCKEPIPSDYYYADLTGNWDWNADGRYGMWPGDFGPGGVDQYYEVLVGRIPYYGSIKDLDAILRKTVNYENQSGDAIQWRKNALLVLPHKKPVEYFQGIKNRFLEPAGWECHRVCDYNYGLDPPPETIPCTMENTIKVWKNGKFGLMLSWGHGRSCSAAGAMDSDHVGELNDAYPAFTVQLNCRNAPPEVPNNLAYSLLRHGAVCTFAATRSCGKMSWLGRDYISRLVEGMSAGEAVYETKLWQFGIGWNTLSSFLIYGDPSLRIIPSEPRSRRRFVNCNAPPGGDGLSWKTAYKDLQDALDEIIRPGMVNEIWVAAGTYKPDRGTGRRLATFRVDKGIAIYGGFTGNETRLDQRDPTKNLTVLSGDIGVEGKSLDNSFHVVTLNKTWEAAVIDGFTITGGNANGRRKQHKKGGGLYNHLSNPTLTNCIFKGNSAAEKGGAIFSCCKWNVITLKNCLMSGNSANNGGAVFLKGRARMTNCTLTKNSAKRGGGFYNDSTGCAVLAGCVLWGNKAQDGGAEIYNGEGGTAVASYSNIEGGINGAKCGGGRSTDSGGNINEEPLFAKPKT